MTLSMLLPLFVICGSAFGCYLFLRSIDKRLHEAEKNVLLLESEKKRYQDDLR